jgi:NAD(P)-dependent dehydrogenase (short-subunit alcohol dehydrogenase family)
MSMICPIPNEEDLTSLFRLDGCTAVVTGASRGIGAHVSQVLDAAGARVVLVARDELRLQDVARLMWREPVVIPVDLTRDDGVPALLDALASRVDGVNVLVNNAAVHIPGRATDLGMESWDLVQRLNLRVAFELARGLAPGMAEGGWGKVVNVASILGLVGDRQASPYVAAKAALLGLTRALGAEWAEHGIGVNALCPGWVSTDMTVELEADVRFNKRIASRVPAGRWGTCRDLTGAVLFLTTRASDFMIGQTLTIDGGLTATW